MKLVETDKYKNEIKHIANYIKQDKKSASIKFAKEIKDKVNELDNFPFKYRKSIYFDNDNIRDMIFKGYTIIYEVNLENNIVEILTIFNKNKQGKIVYGKSSE